MTTTNAIPTAPADSASEPLFAAMLRAATRVRAEMQARYQAWQAEEQARNISTAVTSAAREADRVFGELGPSPDAWRGYEDRSAMTSLGEGCWLRWIHASYQPDGQLMLVAPCPHDAYHEHGLDELVDVAEAQDVIAACNGGPLAACLTTRDDAY
jgi:hypothetical protein